MFCFVKLGEVALCNSELKFNFFHRLKKKMYRFFRVEYTFTFQVSLAQRERKQNYNFFSVLDLVETHFVEIVLKTWLPWSRESHD